MTGLTSLKRNFQARLNAEVKHKLGLRRDRLGTRQKKSRQICRKKRKQKRNKSKTLLPWRAFKQALGNHHKTSHPEGWLRRKDVKK
jgi:hypothetical protein